VDIAELGFKAETSDLDKATLSLNKLKAAAGGVSTATNKVDTAVTSAGLAAARASKAKANATLKSLQTTTKASKADLMKARSAMKAAVAEEANAKSLHASAVAADKMAKATLRVVNAEKRVGMTRNDVSSAAGGVANDNMPNRFNTANVAAQFQDIGVTAAMGMNPLTIALQQGTQLSAILNTMKNPLQGLAVAFKSVFNAVSLGTIAIIALVVSLIQLVDWSKFTKNSLNSLANGIEAIGPYAIAAAASIALFSSPAIVVGLASLIKSIAVLGTTTLVAGTKMAGAWLLANPLVLIVALLAFTGMVATWAANTFEPFRNFVNKVFSLFDGLKDYISGVGKFIWSTANFGDTTAAEKQMEDAGAKIAIALQVGIGKGVAPEDYVGAIGKGVDSAVNFVSSKLRGLADGIGVAAKAWDELVEGGERTINTLRAEGEALTMSSLAAEQLTRETQLLNEAQQKNIELTPQQRQKITELAEGMAVLSENNKKLKDRIDFTKSATKSFFSNMRQGLMQGRSAWETFGNAVTSVLDKILDKILNVAIEAGFNALATSFGGGQFNAPARSAGGAPSPVARPFAKGGTFTNSVVNQPTPFTFANGGSFGVMGEAGPEAVMPLKRGPDGSLGVQMHGSSGGGGGNVIVNVTNNSDANAKTEQRETSDGIEIDVLIDEMVSEKLGTPGTATNRSLNAFNSRQLIKRG